MDLVEVTQVVSIFAGCAVLGFIAVYSTLARWWRSQEGQTVMLLAVIIAVAVVDGILGRLGLVEFARGLAVGIWAAVGGVFIWLTVLLIRAQVHQGRMHRGESREEPSAEA